MKDAEHVTFGGSGLDRAAELRGKSGAIDDILRAVDYLNTTTQWVQSRAEDDELEEITDDLLLAMHDLRSVLVRKKADRLMKTAPPQDAAE